MSAEPLLAQGPGQTGAEGQHQQSSVPQAGPTKGSSPRERLLNSPAAKREHLGPLVGWRGTIAWAAFITLWYLLLQRTLARVVPSDPEARKELFANIPERVYHYSEAAFFTSSVLALVNLLFEDTPDKQQLALLSFVIKGLSWHSDHLITSGGGVVKRDYYGALFLPSRYVQWSCSTPTMIFTISRISSLGAREVAITMLADWLMVVNGWASSETPLLLATVHLALCFLCFAYVQRQLWRMLQDAMHAADTQHSRICLWFTLGSTVVVWNLFWVAWVLSHLGVHSLMVAGEALTIFCNFSAKVVFSTSIMYNNFVTLAERRRAAQAAREHADRIQAVRDLTAAVKSRDSFLEVVGHELRTPLNAVLQLSSALAVGAGGALSLQAREWLTTIKASAGHLLGVVNDILTFRASQATTLQLNQELVAVSDVIDEVMRQLLPSAGPNITLEKVVHARLSPLVADRRRLALALSSLVANAIKFMDKPAGHVTVKAYPDRGARHIIIKVVDDGPGLTPTQLAQLSNPTVAQSVDTSGRKAGGLGLGLPITHQLVAAHGGVVRLSSPGTGKGTTVLLRLPVLQAVTHPALRHDFTVAYTSLGYNMEQLLSPELAAAEGRACPTFGAEPGSIPSKPNAALATYPNALRAIDPLATNASIGSTASSMDLGASVMQHVYKWHPGLVAAGASNKGSNASLHASGSQGGMAALSSATGGPVTGPQTATQDEAAGGRPSEDSLAAWEAYADRMGYSLPQNLNDSQSGPPETTTYDAMPTIFQMTGEYSMSGYNRKPDTSAVASVKGVPGQAVALMSSLYAPDVVNVAPGGRSRKGRAGSVGRTAPASQRDSIEECDEEGQEPEEPTGVRDSVDVVHTPQGLGSNVMLARASDTSRGSMGDTATTDALINAAAQASQVVSVAAMRLQTTVADLEQMSETNLAKEAAAQEEARKASKKNGSPSVRSTASESVLPSQLSSQVTEWDQYVGAGPQNAVCNRQDAPEVVAENVRMSMQYQEALAKAQAANLPLEPQWETWVARIPEHHKANKPTPPA